MNPKGYWENKHKKCQIRKKQKISKNPKNQKNKDPHDPKDPPQDPKDPKDPKDQPQDQPQEEPEDCDKEHPLSPLAKQLALLVIASLAFLIAAYWKSFLEQAQGDYFKNNLWGLFIFAVGLTLIAAIIIYYLGTVIIEDDDD